MVYVFLLPLLDKGVWYLRGVLIYVGETLTFLGVVDVKGIGDSYPGVFSLIQVDNFFYPS